MDYENVYYFLKNNAADRRDIVDLSCPIDPRLTQICWKSRRTRHQLDAYADFERIKEGPMGDLYLIGRRSAQRAGNRTQERRRHAALHRRDGDSAYPVKHRQSFILVAGDRDYIPVIQHLKKHGRKVRVAGFRGSVSGDLLLSLGEEYFIDAAQILPDLEFISSRAPRPPRQRQQQYRGGPRRRQLAA